jgi:UDP-N-acetylmuramoyl-L-alanyl-D-glutamate--2,6-diaminopimelate ligase
MQAKFGFPARGTKVIAVTGTNGKSTTASYINEVLKSAGLKTAVLTTVYYEIDGKYKPNRTHFTIDKQSIVQKFFRDAKKAGVDWVVLEVTSHALDQGRIMGVPVEIAVITNLTQDHLDYHGTMEEYARVKSLLLRDYGAKWAVLNADDKWYEYFLSRSRAEVFSFGTRKHATAQIKSIKTTPEGSSEDFVTEAIKLPLKTSLIGEYNLYNVSAAASVGFILGLDSRTIQEGIANLKAVAGRMEPVEAGQNFKVFVDFAITSDALEQALSSLQKITPGKVRVVFGATGDRDKGKRPIMGQVAAKHADVIYLTDDETYTEDPDTIREAVYRGIKAAKGGQKTKVIPDRLEAIKTAFKDARKGDTVLLTGLGHEDTRNMGGKQIRWSEAEIAKKLLKKPD